MGEVAAEVDAVLLRASVADVLDAQSPALRAALAAVMREMAKGIFHAYKHLAGLYLVAELDVDLVDDAGPEGARLELVGGLYSAVGGDLLS